MRAFTLRRPTLGLLTYLSLFALYIALFLNLAFWQQAYRLLPVHSLHSALVYLSMPVVLFCALLIILTLTSFVRLHRLAVSLFVLLSAAAQYFIVNFSIVIDRGMIDNILDTTPAESFALLSSRLVLTLLTSGVLMVVIAWWVKIRYPTTRMRGALVRIITLTLSMLAILLVALLFYKDYASLFRNNKQLVKSLNPSNSLVASWSWYIHNRLDNLPLVKIGEDAQQDRKMQGGRKNLTIVIVGETSRAANFSLGDYPRETNPRLKQDGVIYYPQTTSCGTATAVSVPCMFSGMPRQHYDAQLAHHQEGLLDVLQRAGIKVLWNENDGGCKGACTRVPTQDMTNRKLPGQCIDGECYDEVLFDDLEKDIDHLQGDGVIVLHTIGSHGPTYWHRYPLQFRQFTPTCDTNEIQGCSQQQLVNTYDNTILYVDYIVDKAIKLLQTKQDKFTTSLVYLSDHGESLGENGVYLHGLPWSIAPQEQTHIPMLIWLSEDYQKRYGIDKTCLQKNAATLPYSQDNLFHTLLGITGVNTQVYQRNEDILMPCRGAD